VHVTHSQRVPDVIGGLEDAWEFFGGTPRRVIVDNLAAAINKADRYNPIFQRTFRESPAGGGLAIRDDQVLHARADRVRDGRTAASPAASGRGVVGLLHRRLLGDPLDHALRSTHLLGDDLRGLPRLKQGMYGMSVDHPEHRPTS